MSTKNPLGNFAFLPSVTATLSLYCLFNILRFDADMLFHFPKPDFY